MRRIFIDDRVLDIAKRYAIDLTNHPNVLNWERNCMPMEKLKQFHTFLKKKAENKRYTDYIKQIIDHYYQILILTPSQFETFHKTFFNILTEKDLKEEIKYHKKYKRFYEHILDCMRYDDIRINLMRKYIKELKIKTCVYCNAQFAITTEEFKDGSVMKRIGTYQFDHFKPKSKFPYLSTSFFNLQPCCSTCNISKSTRESYFNLYTDQKEDIETFTFRLSPQKALELYLSKDMENLEIQLSSNNPKLLNNHQDLFHIDQIYTQHTDVAESIIVKSRSYNDAYMESLKDSLNKLFPNGTEDPDYFFWGYYMKKELVHQQPLSKLVQDIVEDIHKL